MSAVLERDLTFVVGRTRSVQDIDEQIEALQARRQNELNNLVDDLEFMEVPLKRVSLIFGGGSDTHHGDVVHLMHQRHEGDPTRSSYWVHPAGECAGDMWCRGGKDGEYRASRGAGRRGTRLVHARIGTFVCLSAAPDGREHVFAELKAGQTR
ncbi:hypothetical protein GCM10007269_27500 [Microbacterium murale]|uniref:Uncharacterized protein n=1 Tax=Microbacterium murale TaxID=1081040 RepID=A0ABQ1RUE8_9MICO|nr:hypothetical protein GCM10007269_27500 [Microbacterium murale]